MRQVNILDYLPEFLQRTEQLIVYADAENIELDALWKAIETAWNDQFLYTMGDYGITRWEKMLNITPLSTDELEDRRFRIINRLNTMASYTYREIDEYLKSMCGGAYTMQYISEIWTLQIRLSLKKARHLNELKRWLAEIIPLNILLDIDLMYNTHGILGQFSHAFLGRHTQGQLRATPFD